MTQNTIFISPRFLEDAETGIGPIPSADPRNAPQLLNVYALLLRSWHRQSEQLRVAGIEQDLLLTGSVIAQMTLLLKRAWSLAVRDYPGFMDHPNGDGLQFVLNKMYDVVNGCAAGHAFLDAQRTIYEGMVADLKERDIPMTRAVQTCFADSAMPG